MEAEELLDILETNLTERISELVKLKNLFTLAKIEDKEILSRTGILLTYAHIEGFLKESLLEIVGFLNKNNLKVEDVSTRLKAISLHSEFNNLEKLDSNKGIFKNEFKGKKNLIKINRRILMLSKMDDLYSEKLKISNKVINLESNVGYEVLERNFYRLGIPLENIEKFQNSLNKILNIRNNVSHNGLVKYSLDDDEYNKYLKNARELFEEIINTLKDYILNEKFLI